MRVNAATRALPICLLSQPPKMQPAALALIMANAHAGMSEAPPELPSTESSRKGVMVQNV